jgi:hypothetical protein
MGMFDDLLKKAAGFVDRQKGRWGEAEWNGFIADMRGKGLDLTKEAEDYVGQVLESMKRFYGTSNGQDRGKSLQDALMSLSDQAAKFVEQSKGIWDHDAWEAFLKDVQDAGVKLSSETTSYVGEILEASKRVYHSIPIGEKQPAKSPAAKPAASKPAAKPVASKPAAKPVASKPVASKSASSSKAQIKKTATGSSKASKKANGKSTTAKKSSSKKKGSR